MKLPLARASAQMSVPTEPPITLEETLIPLGDHPDLVEVDAEIAALRRRIDQAEARKTRARHAHAGTKPAGTPLELAQKLSSGLELPSADPRGEIAAADSEIIMITAGVMALNEQRAEIVSRLNYETSLRFRPQHEAELRRLDAAIGEVHAALSGLIAISDTIQRGGYTASVAALPSFIPSIVFRLGNPDDSRFYEAWSFRQWLRKTFGEK